MRDISATFAEANLLAERATKTAEQRHQHTVGDVVSHEDVHNFDPWFIARVRSGQHRAAKKSLQREGFEAWYPQGRLLTKMPNMLIGPKKRKQIVLREDVRMPYGDYIFLRRLFGSFSLLRLFDLNGMMGLCLFGIHMPAIIHDFEIELLRLSEFNGKFDRCDAKVSSKQLHLAEIRQTDAAKERGNQDRITHSILDTTQQTLLFVEAFGRITRVVAGTGDLPLTER